MELSNKMVIKAFLVAILIVFTTTIAVLFIILHIAGPEPQLITVIVENQTTRTLQIYEDDLFWGKVAPDDELTVENVVSIFPKYTIIAKDPDGSKVFETNFTSDDLRGKREYRIIIPPEAKPSEPTDNATLNRQAPRASTLLLFKLQ